LDETVVHDLNLDSRLPFESETFDAVICTASVEYLIDPLSVFKDVYRVLSPGGVFAITFSNRWFSPKAIKIWPQLHEFERMGLVTEYFLRSEKFRNLHSFSQRGLPRDKEDKYYDQIPHADPVYAVWGYKSK
jgi:SAM-dependent methyltransferase